jgi:two-component system heavy metal sensor histidine kinase CusS
VGRRPASIFSNILVLMTLSTTVLFVAFATFHLSASSRAQRKDHEQYISATLHFIRAELEETLEESARLSRMIDSLILRARASHGTARVDAEQLDVAVELERVAEHHRAQAEEIGARIVIAGAASVSADRTLLRRALSNVLSDALEASPAGGVISTSVSGPPDQVEITIQDQGTGITAEDLPSVFERFHRSPGARVRRPEGSGLGLAIVKSIVELHGGTASIDSRPGSGTRVRLVLPSGRR